MIKRSIPSPAMVIACVALFVALGGTGYAASQLASGNSGQATASKKSKQGPRGPKGPKGAKGAKGATGATGVQGPIGKTGLIGPRGDEGPAGPRGPSDGRYSAVPGDTFILIGKTEAEAVTLDSVTLPPGSWMLTGQASLTNLSGALRKAWCSLNVGSSRLALDSALDDEEGGTPQTTGDATVLASVNLPAGGIVDLRCWAQNVPSGNGTDVYEPDDSTPAIQAIQVETLTNE